MERNEPLARLDTLVGDWDTSVVTGDQELFGAWTSFEWIEDGAFLRLHADAEFGPQTPPEWVAHSPFPVTTVIGLDDFSGRFAYVYSDGRGVHRVYDMTFEDREWKIWGRSGPEFFQRFFGTLSDDGNTIDARWEQSPDGESWKLDFELKYTRR